MATELAVGYVTLLPSMKGFQGAVEKALGKTDAPAKKQGQTIGQKMSGGITSALKTGAKVAGGAALAGIGTALIKGFGRLTAIDAAKKKLEGLGHSGKTVSQIMSNANKSVKGTAFGLDEAATTAAGAVASGVKPGKDLERTLSLVADAATIAGTDMGSMGSIFNKVAASGKLQGDVIAQLQDAGVPVLQFVAKEMGVTAEEASKMASKGEVSFDTFRNAMESGLGGAAQKSGETFKGAWANAMAAVGRVGANLLSGIFPQVKDGLGGLTDALVPVEAGAKKVGKAIADMVTWLKENIVVVKIAAAVIGGIVAAVALWNAAMAVNTFVTNAAWVATKVWNAIMGVGSAVMKIATAAQWAWNAAMSANPIMLVVLAIAALIAGLVWFFTQTKLGQEIWANFTQFLSEAWANISQFFIETWTNISQVFMDVWNGIVSFFTTIWNVLVLAVQIYIQMIMTIWTTVWNGIKSFFVAIWNGIVTGVKTYINIVKTIITTVINTVKSIWSSVWGGISSFFSGIWNGIVNTVKKFSGIFKSVFGGIKGIIVGAFNGVVTTVKNAINGIIGLINGAIDGINAVIGAVGGALGLEISIGHIPKLADGAIINASRGGSLVNVGEGRYDEAVVPLGGPQFERLADALVSRGAGSQVTQYITTAQDDPAVQARVWAREASRGLATV
ncbi:phage tail protein [Paramicrobacterium chengjingii]|uniref:Tape measure protein n=1 Tax=Paramicrobacterium chengjingii TaxID=2769067 RepID=A0ABX6YLS5_9MICO|nr:tape measure protein [Microbacterium chengjingii]QPZ39529.1 tape measure protein [Microbacterium chengjingii]